MRAGFRYIAMVLIAALGGGAQACIAFCSGPVVGTRVVAAAGPEKAACHHCSDKGAGKPVSPGPQQPCKQCQMAGLDRLAVEGDQGVVKAAVELSATPLLEVVAREPVSVRLDGFVPVRVHPPPGERLHAFCVLLI